MVVTDQASAPGTSATRRTLRGRAAWAGVLAAAVALGVAELVSAMIEGTDNPVVSVGEVVVDHVPSAVKDWAISVFGTTDKVALIIGTLVLLVFAAAGLGILAARRRWVGDLGIAAFALVGVAAAVTRPDGDWVDALPALAGAGAAAWTLRWLLDIAAPAHRTGPAATPRRPWPSTAGSSCWPAWRPVRRRDRRLVSDGPCAGGSRSMPLGPRSCCLSPPPRSSCLRPARSGSRGWRPTSRRTATSTASTPRWSCRRSRRGVAVADPRDGGPGAHAHLRRAARPPDGRADITLACVSNLVGGDLVGNARWLGFPLAGRCSTRPACRTAPTRSWAGRPTAAPAASRSTAAFDRDAIVAVGMNGEPCRSTHGFPVRLVVPGLYGYVSAKVADRDRADDLRRLRRYWVRRGCADRAPIKTMSRIDTPGSLRKPEPGTGGDRRGGVGPAPRHRQGRGPGRRRAAGRRPSGRRA